MEIGNLDIAVNTKGIDDAVASLERLAAAAKAAKAAMGALGEAGGNVEIKVCGSLATATIANATAATDQVRRNLQKWLSEIDANGVVT